MPPADPTVLPPHALARPPRRDAEHGSHLDSDVMVAMRDGVKLATDVYRPAKNGKPLDAKFPVVLERTPYDKRRTPNNAPDGPFWAGHGYVFVAQDCRGRFKSEGIFVSYPSEGNDGVDTVEWILKQDWCDGRICLTGSSYFASTAQAILCRNPPGIAAAVIRVGAGDYHEDGSYYGGARQICHDVNYALSLVATSPEAAADPSVKKAAEAASEPAAALELMRTTPLPRGKTVLGLSPPNDDWYQDWQTHELYDEFWKQDAYHFDYSAAPDVPVLMICEWYDAFLGGMLDGFNAYKEGKQSPVHAIASGGHHFSVYSLSTLAGSLDMGSEMPMDVSALALNWFDQFVLGKDAGISRELHLFHAFRIDGGNGTTSDGNLAGSGSWRSFTSWPPEDSKPTAYYLGPSGTLSASAPEPGSISYDYDPANPVPTIGGNVSSGNQVVLAGPQDQRGNPKLPQCSNDLPLADRDDVVCFRTEPLEQALEITGAVYAALCVASSCEDTDFTCKVVDERPDGTAINVVDGVVRARLRGFTKKGPGYRRIYAHKEEPLVPNQPEEIEIEMWGTSWLFGQGHRIRVDISSSNFPRFDINPNTGERFIERSGKLRTAHNSIFFGGKTASRIVLPVRKTE